ncbi:MAG: transcriptional repressor [Desulfuromonadales bacterium]|nr:transcriptional repressor [Desulfuromonadales bacterium]MBN2791180.1 transcriptional repressor [Desulfuromonadales bacterium]
MDRIALFNDYLHRQGLKNTSQRMAILERFLRSKSHYSTEDLYLKLRKDHPKIGYATVHRTLKLLAECGIAVELNFGDGQTRYEPVKADQHHDHLICTSCGKIIEFSEPRIENLQEQVARQHDFIIHSHRHELYGQCAKCAAENR